MSSFPEASPFSRIQAGYALGATGAILLSTKGIAIKLAYAEGTDATTLLALRMMLALPVFVLAGVLALRERKKRGLDKLAAPLVLRAILIGLLGYWLATYLDFLGLEYISAQFERLILFTYPLFTVIFGVLFFSQRVRPRALFAFIFSYAGLGLIFASAPPGEISALLAGGGLVLASAVVFAMYQLLAKSLLDRIGPQLFTSIAMSAAGVAMIAQFLLTRDSATLSRLSSEAITYALFLALAATIIPAFLMNAALHRISAQANATIGTLSPIATILLAALVLDESLTGRDWIGAALIMAGVVWFTLMERK